MRLQGSEGLPAKLLGQHLGQRECGNGIWCSGGAVGVTLALPWGFAMTGACPVSEFPVFWANAAGSSCATSGLSRSRQWSCSALTFSVFLFFKPVFAGTVLCESEARMALAEPVSVAYCSSALQGTCEMPQEDVLLDSSPRFVSFRFLFNLYI